MSAHDKPDTPGTPAPSPDTHTPSPDRPGNEQPRRPAFLDRAAPGPRLTTPRPTARADRAGAKDSPENRDEAAAVAGPADGPADTPGTGPGTDPDTGPDAGRTARRARRMRRRVEDKAPTTPTANEKRTARRERLAAEAADDDDEDDAPVGPAARRRARLAASDDETRRERVERRRAEREARRMARPQPAVRPAAGAARFERRHMGIVVSFLLLVLLPVGVSSWYLYNRAVDQYASFLGFSVRSESGPSSSDLLGGLTSSLVGMTSSSSTDTDILYKFIQSRDLVERIDARLDLRTIWSKAPGDPVFGYRGNASLEDLLSEWNRKVQVYYDNGMIDLRVLAFEPADARNIAQAVLDESTVLINQLNDVAREDALRYSRAELDQALERLKIARQAVTQFRNRHQLVDPTADVQGQIGVVSSLQQQLAEQLVSLGLLQANAQSNDPRISQTQLRIKVIREQIEAERQKFGSETASGELLSELVGQYEGLSVDREFAERTYTAALASFDSARAEAARQSRYLAAYVQPTLAQDAEYPERSKLILIIGGFLLLMWVVGVLIFYSLRDRR